MIFIPFGFFAVGGSNPENLDLPFIAFVGDNEFGYTPGVWDDSVTSVDAEWYTDGVPSGESGVTFIADRGDIVTLVEKAYNAFGDTEVASDPITVPDLITPPVVNQTVPNLVVYTTAGVWSPGTITSAVWTVNGVPTATAAVIGVSFDARTIGAATGDIVTVTESITPGFGTDIGNQITYASFDFKINEEAGLDFNVVGSVIDAVPAIIEEAGLDFNVAGFLHDDVVKPVESTAVVYTITGSIA